MNCRSINAKFVKLQFFIDYINGQIAISVICILESCGHEGIDLNMFTVSNYRIINQNRRLSTHGGLITYVYEDFSNREINADLSITSTSNLFEILLIELWRKGCTNQKYIVGNIYRLPLYLSDDVRSFTKEYERLKNTN